MLLVLDNRDSFVYNLARYFERLGQATLIVRSDQVDADEVERLAPRAIVLSPGPSTPENAGCCLEVVRRMVEKTPLLGVCLGHQAIAAALGGRVFRTNRPCHGQTSHIDHDRQGLFANAPSPLEVCRYHSLAVDAASLPSFLRVAARADDGTVMAIEHGTRPVFGVQFHPEAILTSSGYQILHNFLSLAGIEGQRDPDSLMASELCCAVDFRPPSAPSSAQFDNGDPLPAVASW